MQPPAGFLGILMLNTRFPRPLGDVGHPGSWTLPVRYQVVQAASPAAVVRGRDDSLLAPFVQAAQSLVRQGALAITTSCGFLIRHQAALQAALPVPVWTSSLLALPHLPAPGVITIEAASLTPAHLQAAGADPATPIEGIEVGSALHRTLMQDLPQLDEAQARGQVLAAGQRLLKRHPQLQSLLLECTNLPPYAQALQEATGLPVHHLMSWVHQQLRLRPPLLAHP